MDAPVIHILVDEDGIPRTIHRRIKVKLIAEKHFTGGETAEAIAAHYDILPSDVYAALAYYHDNREIFEQQERENRPLIDDAKRYSADLRSKIAQRMQDAEQE
jgi:uncharacterized protein (DUF433 family)